jgi:hypothetical protein
VVDRVVRVMDTVVALAVLTEVVIEEIVVVVVAVVVLDVTVKPVTVLWVVVADDTDELVAVTVEQYPHCLSHLPANMLPQLGQYSVRQASAQGWSPVAKQELLQKASPRMFSA